MALVRACDAAAKGPLLSIKFNNDHSCLVATTERGFSVWNMDPFALRYRRDLARGVGLATVLFRSNIVMLVGGGARPAFAPHCAMLWDDFQGANIAELQFNSPVRGIEMTRDVLAIALGNRVYVYGMASLEIHTTVITVDNPRGLVDVRAIEGGGNVLTTLSTKAGYVEIRHPLRKTPIVFRAHEMPIMRLALSLDGSLLATASEKGTVVRVWETATGQLHAQMRRGKDAASINGLAFSRDSKWLCASSDRGTVHVFDLAAPTASDGSGGLLHYIGSTGVLGSGVSEYSKGHFSKAQIHGVSPACLCAFGSAPGQVLVADMDGVFAIYLFDPAKGGEARIERRFLFARGDDDGGG